MTTLIKYLLLTVIYFSCSVCYSQKVKISSHTKRIVAAIQKTNRFETAILPEETKSEQIENFNLLKTTASVDELRQLTSHKNGVVRVYSFKALSERQSSELYEIILDHIADNEVIDCFFHGFEFVHSERYKDKVAEFFVSCEALSFKERQALDSILIFSNHYLDHTDYLLRDIEPQEKYYEQIKNLAQKREYENAVIALAKFKKSQDLSLIASIIKETPDYSLASIELFPDQYFKNVLNYFIQSETTPYGFYAAVAVYQDSFAFDYFDKSIQEPAENAFYKKQKAKEIYKAMAKYRCPAYNELFFQLWESDFIIDDSTFSYLKTIDQKRCVQLTIRSLEQPNRIDNSTLVIEDLLEFLIEVDSSAAKDVIKYNVDSANVHMLSYFVDKARHFKNIDIINSMFVRLDQTDNGHIFVPIVATVLSYNDSQLNIRLLESIRANNGISGWGLEKVTVLLDNYGLRL